MSYYYLDDDRVIQGPFTAEELKEWHAAGYFTNDTPILPGVEGDIPDRTLESEKVKFKPFHTFFTQPQTTTTTNRIEPSSSSTTSLTTTANSTTQLNETTRTASLGSAAVASTTAHTNSIATSVAPATQPMTTETSATIESSTTTTLSATPSQTTAPPSTAPAPPAASIDWYYLDDEGNERGPFPTTDMAEWFTAGYFTLATKARTSSESECRPLESRTSDQVTFVPTAKKAVINPEDEFEVDMEDDEEEASDENEDDDEDEAEEEEKSKLEADAASDDQDTEMKDAEKPATVATEKLPWFYTDRSGVIHGPFTPLTMLKWHRAGFFAFNDTPIRRQDESEPIPLSKRIEAPSFYTALPPSSSLVKENRWYYLDAKNVEHGPFLEDQMRGWYEAGYLKPTLKVRQVGESEDAFTPISTRDCTFTKPKPHPLLPLPPQQPLSMPPYPYQPPYSSYPPQPYGAPYPMGAPPPTDYSQTVAFSSRGRSTQFVNASHFDSSSVPPTDRALRQLNHFMQTDKLDQWQVQMNQRQQQQQQPYAGGRGGYQRGGGRGGYRGGGGGRGGRS